MSFHNLRDHQELCYLYVHASDQCLRETILKEQRFLLAYGRVASLAGWGLPTRQNTVADGLGRTALSSHGSQGEARTQRQEGTRGKILSQRHIPNDAFPPYEVIEL